MNTKKFAIVGGGIGGLTLAISLQQKGFDVSVFESAPEIKPLGAGLVIAANAVKAYDEIGLKKKIISAGKIINVFRIKDASGRTLSKTGLEKISAPPGIVNNFSIHRADLHEVLLRQLTPGTVQVNKRCTDVTNDNSGITIRFHDGAAARADYLVACDGVHSAVRLKLLPGSFPRYAGYTCWRGVVETIPENVNMEEASESWGRGKRFGIVPLSKNQIYWFACMNASPNDQRMKSAKTNELRHLFKDFHSPIPSILENTPDEKIIWNDIIDIRPLKRFAFGNIVLMGDAAHAMTPNMGQGACMAIEDAVILGNLLSKFSPEEAFRLFEKKRIGRTTAIVNRSWRIGKIAQLENPILASLRNFAIRKTPTSIAERQANFISQVSFH